MAVWWPWCDVPGSDLFTNGVVPGCCIRSCDGILERHFRESCKVLIGDEIVFRIWLTVTIGDVTKISLDGSIGSVLNL